jgi:PDDEXK-like domain of unknown function (DUF3799)
MTARILDATPEQYHADPCAEPSLSSSVAHTLVTRSALHAWTEHPRFGNQRAKATDAQDDGSIIHRLMLGKGATLAVISADNYKTKAAQQARDDARARGEIPVLERKHDALVKIAAKLAANLADYGINLSGGSAEVAIEYEDNGVLCRSMLDYLKGPTIIDLKSIRSADPKSCSRAAHSYGYDIAHAAYTTAVERLYPEFAGRTDFLFVFMELEPPYAVVPCRMDGAFAALGRSRWERAQNLWRQCLATNRWPSYVESITTLEAPPWAMVEEEGNL